MRNLPAPLREKLTRTWNLTPLTGGAEGYAGNTRKILADLRDGEQIEAVWIPAGKRRTVCVSSQVGCRFNCAFCASGKSGFTRNLEPAEIVTQVLLATQATGEPPTHIVFMGIGEPFDNYDAVLKAVRIFHDPKGLNIGARRMTISTCGVIPGIRRLSEEGMQIELSVSLHAPTDALRTKLMPVNHRYPIAAILNACRDYVKKTNRIITFEYTLIAGLNDTPEQARALAALLRRLPCRCNLIPLSPVAEFGYEAPPEKTAAHFVNTLAQAGINATLRLSKGLALKAACGQLRTRHPQSTCIRQENSPQRKNIV